MRLQLDSSLTGANSTGIGQSPAVGGYSSDSSQIGSGASGAQDSIQISGPSSALNRLAADRSSQIQQLTLAVQGGSYQVSSTLVGKAIVDYALA